MKITLNVGNEGGGSAADNALKAALEAARNGDWKQKQQLTKLFMPLITKLAERRAKDVPTINSLIEAGSEGLMEAARRYGKNEPVSRFQLFAVDFIEKRMDGKDKKEGLLARLFKR